ncbi:hypothetical protein HDU98_008374 [Podochytrium sp. JEL0797]|nr:hypothetical protein HDU98_008374 [Podochytrium sp. JEL0797]
MKPRPGVCRFPRRVRSFLILLIFTLLIYVIYSMITKIRPPVRIRNRFASSGRQTAKLKRTEPIYLVFNGSLSEQEAVEVFTTRLAEYHEDPGTFTSSFQSLLPEFSARFQQFDTGRSLNLPSSHFALIQPPSPSLRILAHQNDSKHFHECGSDQKVDARFCDPAYCKLVSRSVLNKTTRKWEKHLLMPTLIHNATIVHESLTHILSAWSSFARANEIAWWIQHGPLLGWFWGGKLLPWDTDLDIQLSTRQAVELVKWNGTVLENRFLIDVNPDLLCRTARRENVIDARVVDVRTGYFMDITALSAIDSSNPHRVYCKTPHGYDMHDLMPLHETLLDGIVVWRPRAVMRLLKDEYKEKCMTKRVFGSSLRNRKQYVFDEEKKTWQLAR